MREQRIHPRFENRDIINITIQDEADNPGLRGLTFGSLTSDISKGGLAFSSHVPIVVGMRLTLTVAFSPPYRPIKNLVGQVAWVRNIPHGAQQMVGIDLSESPAAVLAEWKSIINQKIVSS
jgi:hypothetical protein